jgi:hypothetical protein
MAHSRIDGAKDSVAVWSAVSAGSPTVISFGLDSIE